MTNRMEGQRGEGGGFRKGSTLGSVLEGVGKETPGPGNSYMLPGAA